MTPATRAIQQTTHAWAAARLGMPVESILGVTFEQADEHWYSEITCDPATLGAHVQTVTGGRYIDLRDEDFDKVIREILSAGK